MKRISTIRKGWDCERHPCGKKGCGTDRESNHGIHNDEWWYAVVSDDKKFAVSIAVGSGVYPASVPPHQQSDDPKGDYVAFHRRNPQDREEMLAAPSACDYLEHCYGDVAFGLAGEIFKTYGGKDFEQPEAFWLALEIELEKLTKNAVDFSETHEKCVACDGLGIVRKS